MRINFANVDGLTDEQRQILASAEVQTAIDTATESAMQPQIEAEVARKASDFESAKADFKKRMDALDSKYKTEKQKLEELLENKDGNATAKELKEAREKLSAMEGQLEALSSEKTEYEQKFKEAKANLQSIAKRDTIRLAIDSFNKENKEWKVNPDTIEVIEMLSEKYLVQNDDGEFVVTRMDGKPLTTSDGMGTPKDWLEYLQNEKPSLFQAPKGSGAPGGAPGGAGGKTISRSDFDALSPQEKMKAASNLTIVE